MKKSFDWKRFLAKREKIYVHCATIKEALNFCKQMDAHGLIWDTGESYLSMTRFYETNDNIWYTNLGTFIDEKPSSYSLTLEWSDYIKTESEGIETMNSTIKSYKVIDNKVVTVEFTDGDIQKAICQSEDQFNLETGIEICLMKHICGGKAKYHKMIKNAMREIKAIDKAAEDKKKTDELTAKKKAKELARKKAREERKRAKRVGEMKEAYLAALKEYNGNVSVEDLAK